MVRANDIVKLWSVYGLRRKATNRLKQLLNVVEWARIDLVDVGFRIRRSRCRRRRWVEGASAPLEGVRAGRGIRGDGDGVLVDGLGAGAGEKDDGR